jgi:DNA-binding SARP family transcriptional activator
VEAAVDREVAAAGQAPVQAGDGERAGWLRFEPIPLVGREVERASLEQALGRPGSVCVLRGEAGVGKTRLAEEALQGLRERLVLRAKATERETPLTYEVITGLLRYLRRRVGLLSLDHCSPRLAPFRPALASLLPEWRSGEATSLADRSFLFAAVTELVHELVDAQPACLFLDDAQWMDTSSLELLQHVAEELAGKPLALLLAVRDGEPNPWLDTLMAALRRKLPFQAWVLRRLGREATLTLAERWLETPSSSLDAALADQLYRETAGNPFYLQEVISGLLETGQVLRRDDRIVIDGEKRPVVTGGILTHVQQRIQRLAPADRTTLEAASVLGEMTERSILQAVLETTAEGLNRSLEVLDRRHLLTAGDRLSTGEIRIAHPLVRQAIYQSLPADDRARWHREAARVLRSLPEGHPSCSVPAIGYHLSLAEAASAALPLLLESADQCLIAQAYPDAAWNLGRAAHHLDQLKLGEPRAGVRHQEGRLWLLRGHLYFSQGRHAEKDEAFRRAWDCLETLPSEPDPALKATAALFRAQSLTALGDLQSADALLEEQRSLLEGALGDREEFLYEHTLRARIYGDRKEWDRRTAVLREGLSRAVSIDSEEHIAGFARLLHAESLARDDIAQTQVLRKLLETRAGPGARPTTLIRHHWMAAAEAAHRADWNEAREAATAMLTLAEQCHHQPFRSDALRLLLDLQALSEPEAARPALRAEIDTAEGEPRRRGRALAALAAAAAESGDWNEAASAAEALLALASTVVAEPDRHGWVHQAVLTAAEAALHRGQAQDALEWLDTVEADDTPPSEFWTPVAGLSLRAWALAVEADGDEASASGAGRAIQSVVEAVAGLSAVRLQAIVRAQLAHATLAAGDPWTAQALLALARPVLLACGSMGRLHLLEIHPGLRPPDVEAQQLSGAGKIRSPGVEKLRADRGARPGLPNATKTKPRLQVKLLGGFECRVDGHLVLPDAWGSRKARSLFKFLLLRRGRPILVGDLLDEFWPDLPFDGARHALRSTVHRMRRALEPHRRARASSAFVQVADDAISLPLDAGTEVDLYEFEDRLRQAARCEAQADLAGANRLREEAIAAYGGELLPHDALETWAQAPREWLRAQYLSALARLADAACARDEPAAAVPLAEQMLDADPTHEPGVRILVRCLAALGRRSEAIRRFDLFAQRLDRDLGLCPEPETRHLVDAMRSGE